jgi:hypothetical protein
VAAVGGVFLSFAVWVPFLTEPRGDLGAAVGILAVVGLVLVVGAATGLERDASTIVLAGRAVASFAAVVLVLMSLGHVLDGRVGFPGDEWGGRLDFTASLGSEIDAARVLVVGGANDLPGEHRTRDEVAYRVVPIGGPSLEGARLGTPRLGDDALSDVVAAISGGELVRPGELLAEFGIGWVAVVDDPSFAAAMSAQVDMDEVPVREDLTVFLNSVEAPRAVSSAGAVWVQDGVALVGPAGAGSVRIADNASSGWGPDWQQDDWANRVSAADGVASFEPNSLRRTLGWVTVGLFLAGLACLPFIRRNHR